MDFRYEGRMLTLKPWAVTKQQTVNTAIFLGSMVWYTTRYFRHNRNLINLGLFTVASLVVSNIYSRALMFPVLFEAALLNNAKEHNHRQHLAKK